ncbi:Hypothetical predicted protein [Paramuricea clavata]|uniref:Uncharacterized protein n=1 Tax=Paramuricea clavata TaxID=317549 RepID=A0A7D9EPS9_PARCT|nr:Hypothetical predicted protein [Paramuricea clavata]
MKFSKEGIRVWRAYGIGPGKLKLWDDFSVPKDYLPPTLEDPHEQHSSLQNHLDCGKHKYTLACETLFDKAIIMYASKLKQRAICDVPQICEGIPVDVVVTPILNMGWALSEKQKTYVLDTYQVGEQTGQKADPVSVSRTMKRARLSSGEPMFTAIEYLMPQQIASSIRMKQQREEGCRWHLNYIPEG